MGSKMMLFGRRVRIPRHELGVKVSRRKTTRWPGHGHGYSRQTARNVFGWLQKIPFQPIRIPFLRRTQEK